MKFELVAPVCAIVGLLCLWYAIRICREIDRRNREYIEETDRLLARIDLRRFEASADDQAATMPAEPPPAAMRPRRLRIVKN